MCVLCTPPYTVGNFPYPSSYILNGDGTLPAYPFREACAHLAQPPGLGLVRGDDLLAGLARAAGVFYNFSGAHLRCFNYTSGGTSPSTAADGDMWDYQYCTVRQAACGWRMHPPRG